MFSETPRNLETNLNSFGSREETTRYILEKIPGYTESEIDKPVGDEQSTLNQFLTRANNGSEWTDPHGFKINVVENKFKITMN
ncbi:hypothetical protein KJ586_00050 [Patescibacteria group bacterium]|nr:hypothetical protein [Patescibacteria group bacterium]MBU4454897.1 hypothetical protein [Patescibacteria group bacterium]